MEHKMAIEKIEPVDWMTIPIIAEMVEMGLIALKPIGYPTGEIFTLKAEYLK